MATIDTVLVFLVSLLIGGLGIHLGALLIADSRDYAHAVVTAGIGALVWALVTAVVGGAIGSVLALFAYLLVVKWRYRTGWIAAGGIALVAWLVALVVLSALDSLGYVEFSALGVPGA